MCAQATVGWSRIKLPGFPIDSYIKPKMSVTIQSCLTIHSQLLP